MHRYARSLVVILGVLLVVAGAGRLGMAQTDVPEGAFVLAADGTVYAVVSGTKFRLAPIAATDALLGTLRDGASAATVEELNLAIAAATAPAPTSPAPAAPSPVQPLIGQTLVVCAESGNPFEAQVVDAQWQKNAAGRDATGNAMWAILFVNMTNQTNTVQGPYRGGTGALQLVDDRGRIHVGDVGFALFDFQAQLAQANGMVTFASPLRPGVAEQRVIGFEVPPDAQRLSLGSLATC